MWSPARLLLASSPSSAQSCSFSHELARRAQAEGLRVAVVGADVPVSGAQSLVASAVGTPLALVGADPLVDEAWRGLPGLGDLAALIAADEALRDPSVDLVILDAGDFARCRTLISLPDTALRLLDSLLTARYAMHRRAVAPGQAPQAPEPFDTASDARAVAVRLSALVHGEGTCVRIGLDLGDSAPGGLPAPSAVAEQASACRLLGVNVDGVSLGGVASAKDGHKAGKDGREAGKASKSGKAGTAWIAAFATLAPEVPAWSSRRSPGRAAPKGRSVAGPFDVRGAAVLESSLVIGSDDEGFTARVLLPLAGSERLRVGRQGQWLVLDDSQVVRWLELPSMLQRCSAVDAWWEGPMLAVLAIRWSPDDTRWPQSLTPAAAGASQEEGAP